MMGGALATSTSWPHPSRILLIQSDRFPISTATRIGSAFEKRRSKAYGFVASGILWLLLGVSLVEHGGTSSIRVGSYWGCR